MNAQQRVWRCVCVRFAIALGGSWLGLSAGCGSQTTSDQREKASATAHTLQEDPETLHAAMPHEETFHLNDREGHDILPPPKRKGVDLVAVPLANSSSNSRRGTSEWGQ